jgi:hypothetical protein
VTKVIKFEDLEIGEFEDYPFTRSSGELFKHLIAKINPCFYFVKPSGR